MSPFGLLPSIFLFLLISCVPSDTEGVFKIILLKSLRMKPNTKPLIQLVCSSLSVWTSVFNWEDWGVYYLCSQSLQHYFSLQLPRANIGMGFKLLKKNAICYYLLNDTGLAGDLYCCSDFGRLNMMLWGTSYIIRCLYAGQYIRLLVLLIITRTLDTKHTYT